MTILKCIQCNKEFYTYNSEIKKGGGLYCSWECRIKGIKKEGNPNWKKRAVKECKTCKKYFKVSFWELRIRPALYCSKKCRGKDLEWRNKFSKIRKENGKSKLEKNSNWRGGKSFDLYTIEWTKELKYNIRKRDNYTCQLCGKNQSELKKRLHIHHIDYDKKNCCQSNLISLCLNCHSKTNFTRYDWIKYFRKYISNKMD